MKSRLITQNSYMCTLVLSFRGNIINDVMFLLKIFIKYCSVSHCWLEFFQAFHQVILWKWIPSICWTGFSTIYSPASLLLQFWLLLYARARCAVLLFDSSIGWLWFISLGPLFQIFWGLLSFSGVSPDQKLFGNQSNEKQICLFTFLQRWNKPWMLNSASHVC